MQMYFSLNQSNACITGTCFTGHENHRRAKLKPEETAAGQCSRAVDKRVIKSLFADMRECGGASQHMIQMSKLCWLEAVLLKIVSRRHESERRTRGNYETE